MRVKMWRGETALMAALLAAGMCPANDYWVKTGDADWAEHARLSPAEARNYYTGFTREGDEIIVAPRPNAETKTAGAGWGVTLNQKTATAVRFSTEAKVVKSVGGLEIVLYADVNYTDGSSLYGVTTKIPNVMRDSWRRYTLEVMPSKPIATIHVYTIVRNAAGCVRFRAVRLESSRVTEGSCRLDTVSVRKQRPPQAAGFYLRDAAAESGFEPVGNGDVKGMQVAIRKTHTDAAEFYDVEMTPRDRARDRATTLLFAIPFDVASAVWHEDPRTDVPLAGKSGEQSYVFAMPCGVGALTQWPIGAVSDAKQYVAIGMDPQWPAVYRIAANADLGVFFLALDLGFAPEHPTARVKFAVFPFAAGTGFRGALVAYDKIYPQAFESRIPEYGVWQVHTSIDKIPNYEDFGFKYMEGGSTYAWDDAHGIYTFNYTEPGSWWMTCIGKDGGLASMPECVATAKGWLAQTTNRNNRACAESWASSVALDANGEPCGEIQFAPWTKGIMWCMNSAPGINNGTNDYWRKNSEARFAAFYNKPFPKDRDGEYIDSAEMCCNFGCDYDRRHFAGMKTPLTFGRDNKRVCIAGVLASYEYTRTTYERLKARGKYTMANSTPYRTSMLIPWIDVPGTEIKWFRPGQWFPNDDRRMLYRRAVCGRKPYCFLQNTEFDDFHPYVERYMQRALAYGMLSGFFSSNGSTDCYFDKRERYEQDRPLFKKYIPLQRKLAEAGWRPLATLAKSSNPNVYVEQFGDRYVTIFNGSLKETRKATITSPRASAHECVTGETWTFANGAREITLPPETVRMLEF